MQNVTCTKKKKPVQTSSDPFGCILQIHDWIFLIQTRCVSKMILHRCASVHVGGWLAELQHVSIWVLVSKCVTAELNVNSLAAVCGLLPFCSPIHSCLWSFFCMSLTTWLLCLRASASLMLDMKWASTMEFDRQCSRSWSGKFCQTFTYRLRTV